MSGEDHALNLVYLVGVLILVGSSLMVRRLPLGQTLKMMLAWVLIFAAMFAVFALRNDFMALGRRIIGEVTGSAGQETRGDALRIRRSSDGHFWADAEVNDRPVRFMIDSGATTTTLSAAATRGAGVEPSDNFGVMVDTANGTVVMQRGSIARFQLGPIAREGLAAHIAPNDMVNVIGMNLLSSLRGWGVEGDVLVLRP
ncbi:retropepsin-like aspartic protease family protein [Sphingosinicella sp.]|uniref:retropepsin-like aspartic protease family protein n=1 Tax=Sphingosinicella sp. TaxID=1917971 RepID=UPI004037A27B